GSYWALQAWVRLKPNFGGTRGAMELHLSHWRGALPVLTLYQNWAYGKYRHFFGRLTYRGRGVYGFTATGHGAPLDSYGRNIYVDTFNSRYGGAGTARTVSSPIIEATRSVTSATASSRTSGTRAARAPSTARPPKAPEWRR